jgi:hypothetical protein
MNSRALSPPGQRSSDFTAAQRAGLSQAGIAQPSGANAFKSHSLVTARGIDKRQSEKQASLRQCNTALLKDKQPDLK